MKWAWIRMHGALMAQDDFPLWLLLVQEAKKKKRDELKVKAPVRCPPAATSSEDRYRTTYDTHRWMFTPNINTCTNSRHKF